MTLNLGVRKVGRRRCQISKPLKCVMKIANKHGSADKILPVRFVM